MRYSISAQDQEKEKVAMIVFAHHSIPTLQHTEVIQIQSPALSYPGVPSMLLCVERVQDARDVTVT